MLAVSVSSEAEAYISTVLAVQYFIYWVYGIYTFAMFNIWIVLGNTLSNAFCDTLARPFQVKLIV